MYPFLYRCTNTGETVQGFSAEGVPDDAYVQITCPACRRAHFVRPMTGQVLGYPKPIDDANWPGIGQYSGALSSVLNWKDGKIQFFLTNGQYIRYDVAKDRADVDYPKDVTEDTWPGLTNYKSLLAGAFNRENGKAYIFLKDGRYIRYDVDADRVDERYPKAINDATWPGMGVAMGSH